MCLILLAWRVHPRYRLVLAANRDEFHARASAAAEYWRDCPDLLGGRDLESMGTWLGVTRAGRIAAVTNVRDTAATTPTQAPSRGSLARDFLCSDGPAARYVEQVVAQAAAYRGFNLLVGDHDTLWWISNRGDGARRLAPGVYGVANDLLDTPWPKVTIGKRALERTLRLGPSLGSLLALLDDTQVFADAELHAGAAAHRFAPIRHALLERAADRCDRRHAVRRAQLRPARTGTRIRLLRVSARRLGAQRAAHSAVCDARVEEHFALLREAERAVEADCVQLRGEHHLGVAARPRNLHQRA